MRSTKLVMSYSLCKGYIGLPGAASAKRAPRLAADETADKGDQGKDNAAADKLHQNTVDDPADGADDDGADGALVVERLPRGNDESRQHPNPDDESDQVTQDGDGGEDAQGAGHLGKAHGSRELAHVRACLRLWHDLGADDQ